MFLVLPEKQQNKIILKTKVNQIYAPESFEGKGSSFFQPRELLPFLQLTSSKTFWWSVSVVFEYENEVQNMWLSYSPLLKEFLVILPMRLTYTQGSYASWKPLNFKRPFSRLAWKSLKFSFVRFGPFESPWSLIEEHLIRSIVTIIVLFITEGYSLIKRSCTNEFS